MPIRKFTYPKFRAWWRSLIPADKRSLADRIGTTVGYLKQVAGGHSRPSAELAAALDRESAGAAPRAEFRPEAFQ